MVPANPPPADDDNNLDIENKGKPEFGDWTNGLTPANEKSGVDGPIIEDDAFHTKPVTAENIQMERLEAVPESIGPYQLVQRLGVGGMGEVWMAQQSAPVKRRVALKLIKAGTGSKEILSRFEAERQALALMNHPNIARILDAGTTPDGQPYFAMELVQGQPLTTYCDMYKLSINERLELFADVCGGVQHAHQKGIIHRDLKPGNILVAVNDGKAIAKVIDFGLAKALESTQLLTDHSLFTGIGQVLGTLKYMSPEQASLDTVDIDTRTDIYALGVILYELLTGSTPLDDSSIKGLAALKILEFIRDKEPVKPSSKLSSSTDEQVSAVTGQRKIDSVRLNRILAGDLDWIVMMALEKDRTRRYESASGFAADIYRYLKNEPVIARPPSLNYRIRKFVRKNRAGVIAASLVSLVLVGGIMGTTFGMFRAWTAEQLAEDRLVEAINARNGESEQRKLAEREREIAERRRREAEQNLTYAKKGNEILSTVFAGLDPKAEYATVAELRNALRDNLQNAVTQLEGSAIGDPLAVAEMQINLSLSLRYLDEPRLAIKLLEQARETRTKELGPDHPDTLVSMNNLALAYQDIGELEKALRLQELTLELRKYKLGLDHPETLFSMNNLAGAYRETGQPDKALQLFEQTLDLKKTKLGPEDPSTLTTMNNLALSYQEAGQLKMVLLLFEQTLEKRKSSLGLDHLDTIASMNSLAGAYRESGQMDQALPLLEQAIEIQKSRLGLGHRDTLASMGNLAMAYRAAGQLAKALPLFEQTFELKKSNLGTDHPSTLTSMGSLALAYQDSRQLDKALPLFEQSLELRKSKIGPDHPDTLSSMGSLALAYKDAGQLDKAIPLTEKTLELMQSKLGPEHPFTLTTISYLASAYRADGQLGKALPLFEQTVERLKSKLGADHPDTTVSIHNLARIYQDANQLDKALPLYEQAAMGLEKLQFRHQSAAGIISNTIHANEEAKQYDQADSWREKWQAFVKEQFSEESIPFAGELASEGLALLKREDWARAEQVIQKCLTIRRQIQPDLWMTFNTQSMLGAALLGQKKYAEAEPLLVAGYEGMKKQESTIPPQAIPRIAESIDRLVDFYTAMERPEETERYRQLRSEYPDSNDQANK